MSMNTSRNRIVASLKELHARWSDVRTRWRDTVAQDFEKEFVAPLEGRVRASVSAMEQMNEMLMRGAKGLPVNDGPIETAIEGPLEGRFAERERELLGDLTELAAARVRAETEAETAYATAGVDAEQAHVEGREQADRDAWAARTSAQREHDETLDRIRSTAQQKREEADRTRQEDQTEILAKAAENELRATKQLEEIVWASETVYEANEHQPEEQLRQTERQLNERRHALLRIGEQAREMVRRYRQKLPPPVEPDEDAAGDTQAEMARLAGMLRDAEQHLHALHGLRLARVFKGYGLHLMWVIILGAAGAATAWRQDWQVTPWLAVVLGSTLVGLIVVTFLLFLLARRRVTATYGALSQSISSGLHSADAISEEADRSRESQELKMREQRDREITTAREKLEPIIAQIKERRTHHLQRIKERYPAIRAEIDEDERRELADVEATYRQRRVDIDALHDAERAAVETRYAEVLEGREVAYRDARAALESAWTAGMQRASIVDAISRENGRLFPPWADPHWETWTPPSAFAPSVRFAALAVDRRAIPGGIPDDQRLEVGVPTTFSLPATLDFADRCSLLLLAGAEGRASTVQTLQAVMLRLLTSLPPGKVRFTIIDPVGLGETFAGFMHLADYEESFVGGRIWTETRHIDQRLADLTEHMETVIQKYLRNEFATIADYNEQAGEIAEPYRFLVISDFPVNFSENAARRLASIVSSGARCGVHTLIGVDTRHDMPKGLRIEDLAASSVTLEQQGEGFRWRDEVFAELPLSLDPAPPEAFLTRMLQRVGEAAKDATRVEVPFDVIAPGDGELWSRECSRSLRVPLGRAGATKLQELDIGVGTSQHALIAGKTGSGKSTLLHVLVTNIALWYSPDEVEFYLVDFKKGVEFKTYAAHELPHARAIAIESDREFGLSVLERIDHEMKRRGDAFRDLGVQDLAAYRQKNGAAMPRILLVIDEFQELFVDDDKIGQDSALLMDRLVRQGRAFGIHVLLGSQTLGGAYSLARSTMGQMQVRIALQCSEADSYLILSDDNAAARLLSRPGEAIYNDAGGRIEGNSPFQICWLADADRDRQLERAADAVRDRGWSRPEPIIVFEGNVPASLPQNHRLAEIVRDGWSQPPRAWLGEAIAIKDPTAATFRRQSGSNLLIVGQRDEAALAMLASAVVALAVEHPPSNGHDGARFFVFDGSPADALRAGFLEQATGAFPHDFAHVAWRDVEPALAELQLELERRQSADRSDAPPIFIVMFGLQRYRMLRSSDEFGFSSSFDADGAEKPPAPDKIFADLLREGPPNGIHTIAWCDTLANLNRTLSRDSLGEFEMRVVFQMSGADSTQLIDSPLASRLGLQRALYASEADGALEKFRPYGLPALDWVRGFAEAACRGGAGLPG